MISIFPSRLMSTSVGEAYAYARYLVTSVVRSRCCDHFRVRLRGRARAGGAHVGAQPRGSSTASLGERGDVGSTDSMHVIQ